MNTYTLNEIAEQEAHKAMIGTILGSSKFEVTPLEKLQLYAALKNNEEQAVEQEKYNLAEVYNEAAEDIFA